MEAIISSLSVQLRAASRGAEIAGRAVEMAEPGKDWIPRRTLNRHLRRMESLTLAIEALRAIRPPVVVPGGWINAGLPRRSSVRSEGGGSREAVGG